MAGEKLYKVMAMKSVRLTEQDQLRNGQAPVPGSYAVPGKLTAVFFTTKKRMEALAEAGAVRALDSQTKTPKDDPPRNDHLPEDFPYRDKLWAAGLKTRSLVREYPDLTEIEGIGAAYAGRILKALDALDSEG